MSRAIVLAGVAAVSLVSGAAGSFMIAYDTIEADHARHLWRAWHDGCVLASQTDVRRKGCDDAMLSGCGPRCLESIPEECTGEPEETQRYWIKRLRNIL